MHTGIPDNLVLFNLSPIKIFDLGRTLKHITSHLSSMYLSSINTKVKQNITEYFYKVHDQEVSHKYGLFLAVTISV